MVVDDGGRPLSRVAFWALLFVPFAIVAFLTFGYSVDDALITVRYAANVAHGHGPEFNPGERVEGFSSPLHLLLQVLLWPIPGGHELLRAKLASLVFGALTVFQGGRLLREFRLPRWAVALACVLIGTNWMLTVSSANGLETTMVAFGVTWLLWYLVRGQGLDHPWRTGAIAAAVTLTRPEAIGVVGSLAICSLLAESGVDRWKRVRWAAVPGATFLLYTVFRLAYFGDLLPNTYYAKRAPLSPHIISLGLRYLGVALVPIRKLALSPHPGGPSTWAFQLLLIIGMLALLAIGTWSLVRSHRRGWYLPVAVATQFAFAVSAGGDWMEGARFVAPVVVALVIVQVYGVVACAEAVRRWQPRLRVATAASLSLVMVVLSVSRLHDNTWAPAWNNGGHVDNRSLLIHSFPGAAGWVTGDEMLWCARPGDLVAWSEMGYTAFERDEVDFLDTRGLVTRAVAKGSPVNPVPSHGIEDPNWFLPTSAIGREILERQPELILSYDGDPPDELFDGRYQFVTERDGSGTALIYRLYRRADIRCEP